MHFGIIPHDILTGGFVEGTTLDTGQTITGQEGDTSTSFIQSFQNLQNILQGGELPETFRQATTTRNLIDLGIQQTIIGEQQTVFGGNIGDLSEALNILNERVSSQLSKLGESVTEASVAAGQATASQSNPLSFLTNNPLLFGLGAGGLAVGAIALFILLKR